MISEIVIGGFFSLIKNVSKNIKIKRIIQIEKSNIVYYNDEYNVIK